MLMFFMKLLSLFTDLSKKCSATDPEELSDSYSCKLDAFVALSLVYLSSLGHFFMCDNLLLFI